MNILSYLRYKYSLFNAISLVISIGKYILPGYIPITVPGKTFPSTNTPFFINFFFFFKLIKKKPYPEFG